MYTIHVSRVLLTYTNYRYYNISLCIYLHRIYRHVYTMTMYY